MKKWEQEQKIKAHQSRLKNAKAAVTNTLTGSASGVRKSVKLNSSLNDSKQQWSSIRSPGQGTLNMESSSKGISDYYDSEKLNLQSIPLYRILRLQNLQQYAKELISRGFGYDLKKFNMMSQQKIDLLLTEIKVLPGHKTKLLDLLDLVSNEMIPEIENNSLWNMQTPELLRDEQTLSDKSIGKSHSGKNMPSRHTTMGFSSTATTSGGPRSLRTTQQLQTQSKPFHAPSRSEAQAFQRNKQTPTSVGRSGSNNQNTMKSQTVYQQKRSSSQPGQKGVQQQQKLSNTQRQQFRIGYDYFAPRDDEDDDDGYDEFHDAIESLVQQYNFSNNRNQQNYEKMFDSSNQRQHHRKKELELEENIGFKNQAATRMKFDSALQVLSDVGMMSTSYQIQQDYGSASERTNFSKNYIQINNPKKQQQPSSTQMVQQQQQQPQGNLSQSSSNVPPQQSVSSVKSPLQAKPILGSQKGDAGIDMKPVRPSSGVLKVAEKTLNPSQNKQNVQEEVSATKGREKFERFGVEEPRKFIEEGNKIDSKLKADLEKLKQKSAGSTKDSGVASSVNSGSTVNSVNQSVNQSAPVASMKYAREAEVHDDICLVPEYDENDKVVVSFKENRLVKSIRQKLSGKQKEGLSSDELNPKLDYEEIKHMYMSYDSGKLTSTIANLDIEEMCFCFACAILTHIERGEEAEGKAVRNTGANLHEIEEEHDEQGHAQMPEFSNFSHISKNHRENLQDENSMNRTGNPVEEPTMINVEVNASEYLKNEQGYQDPNNYAEDGLIDSYDMSEGSDFKWTQEGQYSDARRFTNNQQQVSKKSLSDISERTHEISHQQNKSLESHHTNIVNNTINQNNNPSNNQSRHRFESSRQEIEEILKESMMMKAKENLSLHRRLGFEDSQNHPEFEYTDDEDDNIEENIRKPTKLQHSLDSIDYNLSKNPSRNSAAGGASVVQQHQVEADQVELEQADEVESEGELDQVQEQDEGQNMGVAGEDAQSGMNFSMISRYSMVLQDNEQSNKRLFDKTYNYTENVDSIFTRKPTCENVQNYCKNICISCQLEKQIPIIASVYIERLLEKSGFAVTVKNWRKITFVAMVMASKIWDDESFENNNFSQACPQFNVIQINEMERVFLNFIDYNLYIKGSDYAKYYFILRGFAQKNKKSFPLRPLDLKTILYLQNNANRMQQNLREAYANPLNKSF